MEALKTVPGVQEPPPSAGCVCSQRCVHTEVLARLSSARILPTAWFSVFFTFCLAFNYTSSGLPFPTDLLNFLIFWLLNFYLNALLSKTN